MTWHLCFHGLCFWKRSIKWWHDLVWRTLWGWGALVQGAGLNIANMWRIKCNMSIFCWEQYTCHGKKIGDGPTLLDKALHVTHMRLTVYTAETVCPNLIILTQIMFCQFCPSHLIILSQTIVWESGDSSMLCCDLCRCIWCSLALKPPYIHVSCRSFKNFIWCSSQMSLSK